METCVSPVIIPPPQVVAVPAKPPPGFQHHGFTRKAGTNTRHAVTLWWEVVPLSADYYVVDLIIFPPSLHQWRADDALDDAAWIGRNAAVVLETCDSAAVRLGCAAVLSLVLPAQPGFIIRSDYLQHRMRDCPHVVSCKSFVDTTRRYDPPCVAGMSADDVIRECSLPQLVEAAAGLIAWKSIKLPLNSAKLSTNLMHIDCEMRARLNSPWTVPGPFHRRRVAVVGADPFTTAGSLVFETARAIDIDLLVLDAPDHWLESSVRDGHEFLPVDLKDGPGSVTNRIFNALLSRLPLDGVCTLTDELVVPVARVADMLGFPSGPLAGLRVCADKFRTSLLQNPANRVHRVADAEDLAALMETLRRQSPESFAHYDWPFPRKTEAPNPCPEEDAIEDKPMRNENEAPGPLVQGSPECHIDESSNGSSHSNAACSETGQDTHGLEIKRESVLSSDAVSASGLEAEEEEDASDLEAWPAQEPLKCLRETLIVKPIRGSRSECVSVVRWADDMPFAVRGALQLHGDGAVIEPLASGPEIVMTFVLDQGHIVFCDVADCLPTEGDAPDATAMDTFSPVGMLTPSALPVEEQCVARDALHDMLVNTLRMETGVVQAKARIVDSSVEYCDLGGGAVDLVRKSRADRCITPQPTCRVISINAGSPPPYATEFTARTFGVDHLAAHMLAAVGDHARSRLMATPFRYVGPDDVVDPSQYHAQLVLIHVPGDGIVRTEAPCEELMRRRADLRASVVAFRDYFVAGDRVWMHTNSVRTVAAHLMVVSRTSRRHVVELAQEVRRSFVMELM